MTAAHVPRNTGNFLVATPKHPPARQWEGWRAVLTPQVAA